jgi:hypothetical protein
MRTVIFALFLLLPASVLFAQDDVFSNKTNQALEQVIRDFPNQFHNIKGDLITQKNNQAEYKSTVIMPGAIACSISKSGATSEAAYSWTCVAANANSFALARSRYKEIYDQIANTIIKVEGQKPFILSGQYRTPTETRNLNAISFDLLPAVGEMKSLKIDLSIEKDMASWKVKIHVYDADHMETATASN